MIGYSDHSIGIMVPSLVVGMGAEIIEKHVTLSRSMKGTDHAGSLEMDGLWRMTRDIRNAESALGKKDVFVCKDTFLAKQKLTRSLASKSNIQKGTILTIDMLQMLSPGNGLRWQDASLIVGKRSLNDIAKNSLVYEEDFD